MKKRVVAFILLTFLSVTVFGLISPVSRSSADTTWQRVDFISGIVTAEELNIRKGPSTKHMILGTVKKNEWVSVLAAIDGWYVVLDQKTGTVGCVSGKYLQPPNKVNNPPSNSTPKATPKPTAAAPKPTEAPAQGNLSADEQKVLNLINQERAKAGLAALKADAALMDVARLKAKDMVQNNYFSHQSPTYGSPFDMMRQFGISFKTAGENIAGNSTEEGAVKAWMNSEGHRKNILNGSFNYTGIGVYQSPRYGKIFVQMFIGR